MNSKLVIDYTLLKFFLVGGVNTLVGYGFYSCFILFRITPALALLFATCLGIVFNFYSTGKFVFKNTNILLIGRFVLVYAIIYGINVSLLYWFTEGQKISPLLAQALLAAPIAILAYYLMKYHVYGERKVSAEDNEKYQDIED